MASNDFNPEQKSDGVGANVPVSSPAGATPANPSSQGQGELSIRDIVDTLNNGLLIIRAKWIWGALAAVVLGGFVAFTLMRRPTEYTAQTTLLAQSTLDKIIGVQSEGGGDQQVRENSMRNFVSVMTSRKFLTKLAESFSEEEGARILKGYLREPASNQRAALYGFLEGKTGVERERGREFFTINVTHIDPEVAILVADRFTAVFLSLVQNEYKTASKEGYELLQRQADALRSQIAKDEEDKLEFRKQNKIISRSDNQSILTERLKRLDNNLTEVRVRRLQLETQYNKAKLDRSSSEYPWDNPYLATYADNAQLRQQFSALTSQRAIFSTRYGPNHPKMRDLEGSIRGLQDNIKRNFDTAVADLENQLTMARQTESQLEREFQDAFNSSIEIEKLASRYEAIGGNSDAMKQTLQRLQQKIGEATLSSQLPSDFMQVVDPAFLTKPRVPKKVLYLVFTFFLSLGAFVTVPLIVNLFDERVKGTVDLEALLGKPLIGAIPTLKGRPEDRPHIVRDRIDVTITEAFVGVAGGLDVATGASYPRCLLVTSTLPGEGKSMIVSNLASAYSQLGKKVIVVDLDLRRPTQDRLHAVSHQGGFLAWAKAGFKMEGLFEKDGPLTINVLPDGTHLVAAGGDDPHPSNYLVSRQMTEFLNALTKQYDVVLIDTPPAGLFQDALVLSRHTNERILVARVGKAPVAQVKKVIGDFDRGNASFCGIVINGFEPNASHRKLAYGYNPSSYGYKHETKA